jgi:hypothetical protein
MENSEEKEDESFVKTLNDLGVPEKAKEVEEKEGEKEEKFSITYKRSLTQVEMKFLKRFSLSLYL